MPATHVYCLEAGFAPGLPGVRTQACALGFPLWADYQLADFAIAMFACLADAHILLVHEARHRQQ